jgi:hypothetical protein
MDTKSVSDHPESVYRRECAICSIPFERGRCPDDARHERTVMVEYVPVTRLQGAVADATQALMDALSWMDPETGKRFMQEPSYKRFVARYSSGGGR